jgi:hypothetical protein
VICSDAFGERHVGDRLVSICTNKQCAGVRVPFGFGVLLESSWNLELMNQSFIQPPVGRGHMLANAQSLP